MTGRIAVGPCAKFTVCVKQHREQPLAVTVYFCAGTKHHVKWSQVVAGVKKSVPGLAHAGVMPFHGLLKHREVA